MQLGWTEILIILGLFLLLFLSERIAQLLKNQARGGKKQELAPVGAGSAVVGGDQNSLVVEGGISSSVVVVGRGNQVKVIHNPDLSRYVDKPLAIFVSYPTDFPEARRLMLEIARDSLGLTLRRCLYLTPSDQRTPADLERDLPAGDLFLLFARVPLAEAQKREDQRAREIGLVNRFYFAPLADCAQASLDLDLAPEAVSGYADLADLKEQVLSRIVSELLDAVRSRNNPYRLTSADAGMLLGLAGQLKLTGGWLEEVQIWLAQQAEIVEAPPVGTPPENVEPLAAQPPADQPPVKSHAPGRKPAPDAAGRFWFEPETVLIPAGDFWMGSDEADLQAGNNEKPRHPVYLDAYRIGRYPVTVAQFRAFVEATGCQTEAEKNNWSYTWRTPRGEGSDLRGKDQHPVTEVSWEDTQAYCRWLSKATGREYCLPTEAQWEKAARNDPAAQGTNSSRTYPWGNSAPDREHCNISDWYNDTTPVGKFSPRYDSAYGCADMAGNVWEWCADWYGERYYATAPRRNPPGPREGFARVLRGGSWDDYERLARCAFRLWYLPYYGDNYFGFRVVVLPSSL